MSGDSDISSDEDVPLEVSNVTAKKQSMAKRQAEKASSKLKKKRKNKKVDLNESLMSNDDDGTSDVQSDTLYSEINPGDEGKSLSDQRKEDMSQLMTDDESSNSNSSEGQEAREEEEDEEEEGENQEEMDDGANGQNVAGEELLGTRANRSNVQSEMNQVENKGKVNQENRIRKQTQVPIQWKDGTNISAVNGTPSNGPSDVSISISVPRTRKRFEIRRADKANRVANRLVYRRPGAALGLNFKEKMLYSTSRIRRIDASTLMANRQRRSHF